MDNYGLTSVSEFLGDMLVYRNLRPLDTRLPSFTEVAKLLSIREKPIPRKSEPAYARVMAYLLKRAQALNRGQEGIQRLIYIGDTQLNDGTAFRNLCRAGDWSGIAFIAAESQAPSEMTCIEDGKTTLCIANRWYLLEEFDHYCATHEFPIDANAAVIIDLDKTALGARGRNDHVINEARLEAVRQTVQGLLGTAFDPQRFKEDYDTLNRPEFHPFTTDNQDYLAYLCLVTGSELMTLEDLVMNIRDGTFGHFTQFLDWVDRRAAELSPELHELHKDIYSRVRVGDPTPFKRFRYAEYLTTVTRMGRLPADAPVPKLLAQEIVITEEVREIALSWHERGALLFGLSDKPDEASLPTNALARRGYKSIHRTPTHAVGHHHMQSNGGKR